MKILITGGAGVLGSSLTCILLELGYIVDVLDTIRAEEAWHFSDCPYTPKYYWRSEIDITSHFIEKYDLIIDAAIASADRPFAIESPMHTALGNILPSIRLLEASRKTSKKPILIYPSSFNALYGNSSRTYSENTLPDPASVYGWTKASVELLYRVYSRAYGLKTVVIRTSSTYGPKGRSDEFPHKVILYALKHKKKFVVRSPRAKRLWTYIGDVLEFYKILLEKIHLIIDTNKVITLHLAGNRGDVIHENIELARIIVNLIGTEMELEEGTYEPGELINGIPVTFTHNSNYTRRLLNWKPRYSVEEGLNKTIEWFSKNIYRYII